MELTNQQIENAALALEIFNPSVSLKTKLRLARNLRKLTIARQDKEFDRTRLVYSAMGDKTKKPELDTKGSIQLTAEEQLRFNPELEALMQIKQNVEIHPIELYDSSVGQKPTDEAHSIDLAKVPIENDVLSRLIDIVFVESPDTSEN